MIHYQAIEQTREELEEKRFAVMFGNLTEQETKAHQKDIDELEAELNRLREEQNDYCEGYRAGTEFHMDGVPRKDEWLGRSSAFDQGFDQAGQDS
jgi:FtsZ-binding cell division protein ZapB